MNKYNCFRNLEELSILRDNKMQKVKLFRSRQGLKATAYDKESIQGGIRLNLSEELSLKICQLELDIEEICKEIKIENDYISKLKLIEEKYNDNCIKIIELKSKGYTNKEIACKLNIGTTKLGEIIKKIKKVE